MNPFGQSAQSTQPQQDPNSFNGAGLLKTGWNWLKSALNPSNASKTLQIVQAPYNLGKSLLTPQQAPAQGTGAIGQYMTGVPTNPFPNQTSTQASYAQPAQAPVVHQPYPTTPQVQSQAPQAPQVTPAVATTTAPGAYDFSGPGGTNSQGQTYNQVFNNTPSVPYTPVNVSPSPTTDTNATTGTQPTAFDLQSLVAQNQKYQDAYLKAAQMSPTEIALQQQLANIKQQELQYGIDTTTGKLNQFYLGRPLELSTGRADQLEQQRQLGAQTLQAQEGNLTSQSGIATAERQTMAQAIQGASGMLSPLYNLATPQRISPGEQLYNPLTGQIVGGSSMAASPIAIANYASQLEQSDIAAGTTHLDANGSVDHSYYMQVAQSNLGGGYQGAGTQSYGVNTDGTPQDAFTAQYNTPQGNLPQKNNNPLNIKLGELTQKWVDQGIATVSGSATDGGQFLKFRTPQDGFIAAQDLLNQPFYRTKTVDEAMKTWSGGGYGASITGLPANTKISDLTPSQMNTLVQKMAHEEGFYAAPKASAPAPTPTRPITVPVGTPVDQIKALFTPNAQNGVRTTLSGIPYVNLGEVPSNAQNAATNTASKYGIKAFSDNDSKGLQSLDTVAQSLNAMTLLATQQLNKASGGLGTLGNAIGNTWGSITGTNPALADFGLFKDSAIKAVTALAGGTGSGLRINTGTIAAAVNNLPTMYDSQEVALEKINKTRDLLNIQLGTAFGRPELANGVMQYGGHSYNPGDFVVNANGQVGKINANGTITPQ